MKSSRPIVTVLIWVGSASIILGVLLASFFNNLYEVVLKKQMTISNESKIFDIFQETPVPILMRVYIFNVTNPEEVQYEGHKPKLQELGPYTYIKRFVREDIKFHEDGENVSYKTKSTYIFDRSLSVADDTDVITTVNPVLVGIGHRLSTFNSFMKKMSSLVFYGLDSHDLFISKSVGEFIFNGYYDSLIDFVGSVHKKLQYENGQFAMYYKVNNSYEGEFESGTGKGNFHNFMQVNKKNGKEYMGVWPEKQCDKVRGFRGQHVPPFVTKASEYELFIPKVCKNIKIVYEKETSVKDIKTYRFVAADEIYKTKGTCYCQNEQFCLDGLNDLSKCKIVQEAPIMMSPAHFYRSDPELLKSVEGLNPTKEKHETFVDIEPTTGIAMDVGVRLQINAPIDNFPGLSAFKYVKKSMLPIFWLSEGGTVTPKLKQKLVREVFSPFYVGYIIASIFITIGTMAILMGIRKSDTFINDGKGLYIKAMEAF